MGNGVTVHHAAAVAVVPGTHLLTRQRGNARRQRARSALQATPPEDDLAPLLRELEQQGFELVTNFTVAPRARRPGMQSRRSSTLPGAVQPTMVDVVLEADEDAVVLTVDESGELDWVFADGTRVSDARTAHFRITAAPSTRATESTRRRRVTSVLRAVSGFLFKFIRRKITGLLIKHLERGVHTGFVRVGSTVPSAWTALSDRHTLPRVPARPGESPRVLLLVHGTFSSTVGSFGALGFSVPGIALLHAMHEQYDHILGWDHRTLSETPAQNAIAMLKAFDRAFPPGSVRPDIDVIAFSRGGLVTRTLLEQLVLNTRWNDAFKRVVFVAATLSGTLLAQRERWSTFVTVMTNLAVAACRGVTMALPPAAVAAVWVETVARGVAALVRFLATALLDSEAVPGLAAMDPHQKVVKELNAIPPAAARLNTYHVVSNDYEPNGPGADDASEAMPSALTLKIWDLVMDAQMQQANDLVVNTSSMETIGGATLWWDRTLALPQNGRTMHTTCFRDAEIVAQLRAWLIDGGADIVPATPRYGIDDRRQSRRVILAQRRYNARIARGNLIT